MFVGAEMSNSYKMNLMLGESGSDQNSNKSWLHDIVVVASAPESTEIGFGNSLVTNIIKLFCPNT